MKVIKYRVLQSVLENGEVITIQKGMEYSKTNEEIAKKEAYNGEYTIEDEEIT